MADATRDDHFNGVSLAAQSYIVITTCAISLYNSLELLLLIFVTFKHWGGLYFWSLFLASFAVIPYTVGYIIVWFQLAPAAVGLSINNIGWMVMITGQSFVLYSRLHLVANDQRILKPVLAMIIIDAVIFHIPTTILNFCANFYSHPMAAARGYKVYEKVQMTGFCLQEFIISGIYIWKTIELLNLAPTKEAKRTMWQLFTINVIIVVMDVGLLVIEYCNFRVYEQVFKGLIYSIKLKLEYAILGRLVDIVKSDKRTVSAAFAGEDDLSEYTDAAKSTSRGDSPSVLRRIKRTSTNRAFAEHYENSNGNSENLVITKQSNGLVEGQRGLESVMTSMPEKNKDAVEEDDANEMYATVVRQMTMGSEHV